ncbi:glycosyltransferase [Yimella sp. cx-573]|nr:glycosyltransferase [Yimella sp. cx-573]
MRIAVLATTRHPLRQPWTGGQEAHTATLITALRARGHHIRLYAREGTAPQLADEIIHYPDLPPISAVAALDPQVPEPDFLRDHHCLVGAMAHLMSHDDDLDVVHNQTLHHLPLSMSTCLATPLVTTLHTPPFPWMELGAALARPTARFVAVSDALARQWTTLADPITLIANGIDTGAFPEGAGGDALAWVGRLVPEKGADLAIKAAKRAGRRLRLAGPISNQEWFDDVIAPHLDDDIEHLGHLDHSATARLLGESAALLMTPRWEEPFGLVVAEAAVTGTPVVALARGGLPEVVSPEIGVLVDPDDGSHGLASAIAEAIALQRSLVRQHAIEAFGADRMAQQYEDEYQRAIDATRENN